MTIEDLFKQSKALSSSSKGVYASYFSREPVPESNKADFVIVPMSLFTSCEVSANGLLIAMHGGEYDVSEKIPLSDITSPKIPSHAKFVSYDIVISGVIEYRNDGSYSGKSIGHNFVVLQYKDEQENVRYRLFQSYVSVHTMFEFIEKSEANNNSHDYSQEEFETLIAGIQNLQEAKCWSPELNEFFKRHFMAQVDYTKYTIGESFTTAVVRRNGLDFNLTKPNTALKAQIIPCPREKLQTLSTLFFAPEAKNKASRIVVLTQDPHSGTYHQRSLDKSSIRTVQSIDPSPTHAPALLGGWSRFKSASSANYAPAHGSDTKRKCSIM